MFIYEGGAALMLFVSLSFYCIYFFNAKTQDSSVKALAITSIIILFINGLTESYVFTSVFSIGIFFVVYSFGRSL